MANKRKPAGNDRRFRAAGTPPRDRHDADRFIGQPEILVPQHSRPHDEFAEEVRRHTEIHWRRHGDSVRGAHFLKYAGHVVVLDAGDVFGGVLALAADAAGKTVRDPAVAQMQDLAFDVSFQRGVCRLEGLGEQCAAVAVFARTAVDPKNADSHKEAFLSCAR